MKFSEGMRLMKCFCLRFSYAGIRLPLLLHGRVAIGEIVVTLRMISNTVGSASSRLEESSCGVHQYTWLVQLLRSSTHLLLSLQ